MTTLLKYRVKKTDGSCRNVIGIAPSDCNGILGSPTSWVDGVTTSAHAPTDGVLEIGECCECQVIENTIISSAGFVRIPYAEALTSDGLLTASGGYGSEEAIVHQRYLNTSPKPMLFVPTFHQYWSLAVQPGGFVNAQIEWFISVNSGPFAKQDTVSWSASPSTDSRGAGVTQSSSHRKKDYLVAADAELNVGYMVRFVLDANTRLTEVPFVVGAGLSLEGWTS